MKRNDYEWLVSQIRNNYATLGRIEKMISNPPALPVQPVQFVQPVQPVQLVQPVADLGGRVQKGFEGNEKKKSEGEKKKSSGVVPSDGKKGNQKKNELHQNEQKVRESVRKSALIPENYTAKTLDADDLNTIIGMYGISVEDIYELNAGQEWMLEKGHRVKSAFFLQIMTKAVIQMDPAAFRQQADKVCEKLESLRSAFVYRNVKKPYRVVIRDRHPEINYIDLSDLDPEEFDRRVRSCMEADRLRGFDLERDSLLRISVYKSVEKDTYALIVSQPHINSDGTSVSVLFSELFIGYALDLNGIDKKIEAQSYKAYAEHLQQVDVDKELDWWKQNLSDAPEDPLLPGQITSELDYHMATHFVPFEDEVIENLAALQKKLKVTVFTILQCLWGIMTARMKDQTSMVFGAVSSGRDSEVSDSMMQAGGFVNILPVKISFQEEERFSELAERVQKDFVNAMAHSHCSPLQIQEALGRKKPVFAHILNYHNYAKPKTEKKAEEHVTSGGIKVIGGQAYDNLSEDLCVYFTEVDGKTGCYYAYDDKAFTGIFIGLLGDFFREMLDSLAMITPDTKISELPVPDYGLVEVADIGGRMTRVKTAGILKKHPVFSSASDDELLALADVCEWEQCPRDYIIKGSMEELDRIPMLVQGRAILYGESSDGWNNPFRVFKEGDILSLEPFFGDGKQRDLLIAGEHGAAVIFIRAAVLEGFFKEHPESLFELARVIEKEKRNYQKLWLNAV